MKKVAVINDLSGFGKCSLTAAIPVLSVQGIQACPLPTAVLSNQTGYSHYFCKELTDDMDEYISNWKKLNVCFDGIITGFISSEKQVDIIENFINDFKKEKTFLLVDPVMADNGKIYPCFSRQLCKKITHLAMKADVITPNITEFSYLTNTDYNEFENLFYKESLIDFIFEKSKPLICSGIKYVIVTGVHIYDGKISNCVVDKNGVNIVSSEAFSGSFSGTGDIFASIVCGELIKGNNVLSAVKRSADFIEIALKATVSECTKHEEGICFEPFLKLL